jgi:exonuclease V gamma subunit
MLTITLNLPKKTKQHLNKDLKEFEDLTYEPREFHIKKALTWYLERASKRIKDREEKKSKGNTEYNTEKDLLESLGLKEEDGEE